jgi:AraC family transcriptional regulator of adaptative response/methylated-DNA-[protein]-cysteine methyltransferase
MNAMAEKDTTRNRGMGRFATAAAKWEALRRRDPAADGEFLYSVKTTGVYCRPSCTSRNARSENIVFHSTAADAERAGFRPCKRCRPDLPARVDREAALVAEACRTIEASDEMPALSKLAARAGISPYHFHRMFKRIAGVTPRSYASAHRKRRVQENLASGSEVTEAIYAAGFNSSSRFYEQASGMLGMKPSVYRQGGEGERIRHSLGVSSLGNVLVAATERGLCAILLGDEPAALLADLERRFPNADLREGDAQFADWVAKVIHFVDDPKANKGIGLPLDLRGTAFQCRVWEALRNIPAGETITYGQIAERIGRPGAARAVGRACADNALAVAIPCHRVVGSNGEIGGYRWGAKRKRQLLERERRKGTK